MTYLINENSPDSAGEYDDAVAVVLLRESTGWHVADPVTGEPIEPEDTPDDTSAADPTENGESADHEKE